MLGVMDWGIGGIDLLNRLRARHPALPFVYWSDSGMTPYGKLTREALARRVVMVAGALRERGVTHVIVACNAASTVLDHPALARVGVAIRGVIEPAIAATLDDGARVVGVIGGRRTIASGLYRRALMKQGRRVVSRVAQPLSALVERGELDTPELHMQLAKIVAPLRDVEALVLACTHYTALLAPIRMLLPRARLIDPAAATLTHVERIWPLAGEGTSALFLTTGDPQAMRTAARLAFGVEIPRALKIG